MPQAFYPLIPSGVAHWRRLSIIGVRSRDNVRQAEKEGEGEGGGEGMKDEVD